MGQKTRLSFRIIGDVYGKHHFHSRWQITWEILVQDKSSDSDEIY